jgi:peptide/nickel transport system substrate-binding protein
MRRDVETAIPQYPYDTTRAQQLLAQAGWNRGVDGVMVHGQTGERFETNVWTRPRIGEKAVTVAADYWKAIGVDAGIYVVPPAREEDREYTSSYPGALMTASGIDVAGSGYLPRIDSREISGPGNRWGGRNKGGYANPKADELWDRLNTTVEPRARLALQREQAQEILADVAGMMLYWEVGGTLALRGVKADITPTNPGWNAFDWDKVP